MANVIKLPAYTTLDTEVDSPADLVKALHAAHTAASATPPVQVSTDGATEIVTPGKQIWFPIKAA